MMELLDELDSIELFQHPKRKPRFSEVTKKQKDIFKAMDLKMPASLCGGRESRISIPLKKDQTQ
jgi:hypothetical protein